MCVVLLWIRATIPVFIMIQHTLTWAIWCFVYITVLALKLEHPIQDYYMHITMYKYNVMPNKLYIRLYSCLICIWRASDLQNTHLLLNVRNPNLSTIQLNVTNSYIICIYGSKQIRPRSYLGVRRKMYRITIKIGMHLEIRLNLLKTLFFFSNAS